MPNRANCWSPAASATASMSSIMASIDASGILVAIQDAIRPEMTSAGITIVGWEWVIKSHFENTDVHDRTVRTEVEP